MVTVPSTPRTNFITLGAPGTGPFSVGFRLLEASAITVYINGTKSTAFTLTADFTDGYDDAATITLDVSQIAGTTIQIDGTMVADREEDYLNPDPGLTRKLNIELGRVWASVSELWQQARRSVRGLADVEPDGALDGVDFAALATSAPEAAASAAAALASQQAVEAIEATLPDWKGAWLTATAYEFGDLVQESGSTYICIVNHTSGTFSTDLAFPRWSIFAQKGTAGVGIGDVLAANNGSEYAATAATFRSNLGLAIGSAIQAFNQLLAAIAGLGANGIIVRTSGSASSVRTITGTANRITVTNGDGVSGNPTLDLSIASQAEAEAGTDTNKVMTAQRVSQAITALAPKGRVLLATKTASASATLDFTEFNNAVYRWYEFELDDLLPSTDATNLRMRFSTNGGSSYDAAAGDYSYANSIMEDGGTAQNDNSSSATAINLMIGYSGGIGNAAGELGVRGAIKLYGAGSATSKTSVTGSLVAENASGRLATSLVGGRRRLAQDTDAVQFLMSSGNLASGTVRMYGLV